MRPASLLAPWLLASLALAAGSAGCLDDDGPPGFLTAMEAEEVARKEGYVEEGAPLREVYSLEAGTDLRTRITTEDAPYANDKKTSERRLLADILATDLDDVPGDGRAPLWIFTFMTGEDTYEVWVTRYGIVSEKDTAGPIEAESGNYAKPIEGWSIDSDELMLQARQKDAAFDQAVGQPDALVFSMLRQVGDRAVWVMGTQTAIGDGEEPAVIALDAATAEPVPLDVLPGAFLDVVYQESGGNGALMSGGPFVGARIVFGVQNPGHRVLVVTVSSSPPPPLPVDITVLLPNGTEVLGRLEPGTDMTAYAILEIPDVQVGDYDAELDGSPLAPANDVSISWCTDGVAPVPSEEYACSRLPETTSMA